MVGNGQINNNLFLLCCTMNIKYKCATQQLMLC